MKRPFRKVDCYPDVLCRVGTLPYKLLESIRWPEDDLLDAFLLLKIRKTKLEEQSPLDVKALSETKKKIKQFRSQFESIYLEQQRLNRATFSALSGNPLIQKGLLQSSPSVWKGVQRYRIQSPQVYRKKERQTERSLAQYLARICAKTSPFSTFTALSINSLNGESQAGEAGVLSGKVRVNNYVFAQVQELLSAYPAFYRQLKISVNPTLTEGEGEYVFLLNSRNVESIQRIAKNEVVELVLRLIQSGEKESLSFEYLLLELTKNVAAAEAQLDTYLVELFRLGLLIWQWPLSGTESNWSDMFCEWLKKLQPFEGKKLLMETMNLLQRNASVIADSAAEERWVLMQESRRALETCFEELGKNLPSEIRTASNAFVTFQNTEFELTPERLFFEDTHLPSNMSWPEDAIRSTIEPLAELVELMMPFRIYPQQEEMLDFFNNNYSPTTEINLLSFYEAFHQERKETMPERVKAIMTLREKFTEKLVAHIKLDAEFDVHLRLPDLRKIMASLKLSAVKTTNRNTFGALLQLHLSNGLYKSYIDAVFTGYGKMLGRFLYLFPKPFSSKLQDWISLKKQDALWVDNSDASFHNANAHPSFLSYRFAMPGVQQYISGEAPKEAVTPQIPLTELTIHFNTSEQRLILKHKEQEVTVFDYGLEALITRSPMYRMLATFSVPQPDLSPLKSMLIRATQQKNGAWVQLPRVTIEDTLVLQRKAWYLNLSELPLRQRTESEAAYFLRINYWRTMHELPEIVFITTAALELDLSAQPEEAGDETQTGRADEYAKEFSQSGEGHKPQYIDFRTPALVSHFGRELKKVRVMLKIEEMLPGGEEMLPVNGIKQVTELVVQWS